MQPKQDWPQPGDPTCERTTLVLDKNYKQKRIQTIMLANVFQFDIYFSQYSCVTKIVTVMMLPFDRNLKNLKVILYIKQKKTKTCGCNMSK